MTKPLPFLVQTGQNVYSIPVQNGSKTVSFVAEHTYIAYVTEYPLPGILVLQMYSLWYHHRSVQVFLLWKAIKYLQWPMKSSKQ